MYSVLDSTCGVDFCTKEADSTVTPKPSEETDDARVLVSAADLFPDDFTPKSNFDPNLSLTPDQEKASKIAACKATMLWYLDKAKTVMTPEVAHTFDWKPQPHPRPSEDGVSKEQLPPGIPEDVFTDPRRSPPLFLLKMPNMPLPCDTTLTQAANMPGSVLYKNLVDAFGADAFGDSLYCASYFLGMMLTNGYMERRSEERGGVRFRLATSTPEYALLIKYRFPEIFTVDLKGTVTWIEADRRAFPNHSLRSLAINNPGAHRLYEHLYPALLPPDGRRLKRIWPEMLELGTPDNRASRATTGMHAGIVDADGTLTRNRVIIALCDQCGNREGLFIEDGRLFSAWLSSPFYSGKMLWGGFGGFVCMGGTTHYVHDMQVDHSRTNVVGSSSIAFQAHEFDRAIRVPDVGGCVAYPNKRSVGPLLDMRVFSRKLQKLGGWKVYASEAQAHLLSTDHLGNKDTIVSRRTVVECLADAADIDVETVNIYYLMQKLRSPRATSGGFGLHQPHTEAANGNHAAKHPGIYKASNAVIKEVWDESSPETRREVMDAYMALWNEGPGGGFFTRQLYKPLSNLHGEEDPDAPPYFVIKLSAYGKKRKNKRENDREKVRKA